MDPYFFLATITGSILIVVAFVGCIVPGLPGPPFGFLSLILLRLVDPSIFTTDFLITLGVITIAIYLLDYILPLLGAKMYNASKQGIWFSIIGMLIGIFFFPPFGMIFGLLIGAIVGELISGKAKTEAIRVGLASFVFSLLAIVIKIVLTGVMTFYFVDAVVRSFL
jgi:uncharacterized protein YqgC (DUF456 family)